jgi:hypothetical protein
MQGLIGVVVMIVPMSTVLLFVDVEFAAAVEDKAVQAHLFESQHSDFPAIHFASQMLRHQLQHHFDVFDSPATHCQGCDLPTHS